MEHHVPLVAYINCGRVELGEAVVHSDGTIDAVVDPDKLNDDTRKLFAWAGPISLGKHAGTLEKNGTVAPTEESRRAAAEWEHLNSQT